MGRGGRLLDHQHRPAEHTPDRARRNPQRTRNQAEAPRLIRGNAHGPAATRRLAEDLCRFLAQIISATNQTGALAFRSVGHWSPRNCISSTRMHRANCTESRSHLYVYRYLTCREDFSFSLPQLVSDGQHFRSASCWVGVDMNERHQRTWLAVSPPRSLAPYISVASVRIDQAGRVIYSDWTWAMLVLARTTAASGHEHLCFT